MSTGQARIAADQLSLRLVEARPYVKMMPHFAIGKDGIDVRLTSEDLTAVPAKVYYDRMVAGVNDVVSGVWVQSRPGQRDILYEHRGAGADLPPITPPLAADLLNQVATLRIATCAIYGTLSEADHRYWEVDALYELRPGDDDPLTLDTSEKTVKEPNVQCDPAPMIRTWVKAHGSGPTPLVAGFAGSKRGEVPYNPPRR